ncbi:putative inorganic phosphate cotransporter [Trichonephila clavipes]|nr:putative inorganic phosphate cotransporter [Trichonephila clavipes]
MLNLSRLKRPPVGEVQKLGEGAPAQTLLLDIVIITMSATNSSRLALSIYWQSFLKRRHAVTILGFLCSVVMHSQRLNLSIAMVAMVNTTSIQPETYKSNITECPLSGTRNAVAETHRNSEFSWNPELQGHILGAGFLGYLLAQIPGGILAGRFGTKVILLVGLFGASICNLLSPVAAKQHAYFLAAAHLLRGIFQICSGGGRREEATGCFPPNPLLCWESVSFVSLLQGLMV